MNVYINYKNAIVIELTSLKELILIKQVHQKSMIFVTIGIFLIIGLNFRHMYAIDVIIY